MWAEDEEAASALVENLVDQMETDVDFIVQCRKETKGGYILEQAEEEGIQRRMVASIIDFGKSACAPK